MHYFAYGSNLDRDDLAKTCLKKGWPIPRLLEERPASIPLWALKFDSFSPTRMGGVADMVFTGTVTDRVYGAVYEVSDLEMKIIDLKEGVATRAYERRAVEVVLPNGKSLKDVVTYTVVPSRVMDQHVPPTKDYLSLLVRNARRLDFPAAYVKALEMTPTIGR